MTIHFTEMGGFWIPLLMVLVGVTTGVLASKIAGRAVDPSDPRQLLYGSFSLIAGAGSVAAFVTAALMLWKYWTVVVLPGVTTLPA